MRNGARFGVADPRRPWVRIVLVMAWGLLFGGLLEAGEPEYVVRDLGVIGDGPSWATGLNEAGQVVGYSRTGETSPDFYPVERGFLWLPSPAYGLPAGLNDLGTLRNHPLGSSRGMAISDDGQIVGATETDEVNGWDEARWLGFSWRDGTMSEIPYPGEPPYWAGAQASAGGNVVATIAYGFSCKTYIWLPEPAYGMDAGVHWLPTLPGFVEGTVRDINTHGQAVGNNLEACDVAGGEDAAFLWLPEPAYGLSAGIHNLTPNLPTETDTIAVAINDSGVVVGHLYGDSSSTGFAWQSGASTSLPFLPGALNELGWIVGRSGNQAVLWRDEQMLFLDDLIPAGSGWTLREATGINDSGQIVGAGLTGGELRAFLLDAAAIFADGFESGSTVAWSMGP